ncbi:uncharacterized protein [Hoplias malabaricus]|uniref:uncharacterized protein n=1 Tax=Hoplias malabaricus TaxID=27720 RepID=UPI003462189C
MLPALCTLFTALSCVSGVMVLTQKPPVLTATKGEKITMDCNVGSVNQYSTNWYKHAPGEVLRLVIKFRKTWSTPSHGPGFSLPKFTSTCSTDLDCSLIIDTVEVDQPLGTPLQWQQRLQARFSPWELLRLGSLRSCDTWRSSRFRRPQSIVTSVEEFPLVGSPRKGASKEALVSNFQKLLEVFVLNSASRFFCDSDPGTLHFGRTSFFYVAPLRPLGR